MAQFGDRYISGRNFLDYAKSLNLLIDYPSESLLEFLERNDLLQPAARVRFPPEIVRRWHKEDFPDSQVLEPIEGDTERLIAATGLLHSLSNNLWAHPEVDGEHEHPLDEVLPSHNNFITKTFNRSSFTPWSDFPVPLYVENGREIYDGHSSVQTFYHAWQIFPLATFMRSGLRVLYDLEDETLFTSIHRLQLGNIPHEKLWTSINLEARHELRDIREHVHLFNCAAYFEAYRANAFRRYSFEMQRTGGRGRHKQLSAYRARIFDIADTTLRRFAVTSADLRAFIQFQADLWIESKRRGVEAITNEYKRSIRSTLHFYTLVAGVDFDVVNAQIGRRGGYTKPILKVILPDWIEDQRDLTEGSLKHWIAPELNVMPAPFPLDDKAISEFCDWIESRGLFQFYWHFRRLLDLGRNEDKVSQAGNAAEAAGLASLTELIANAVLFDKGLKPRGMTLAPKLNAIFGPGSTLNLHVEFNRYKKLTQTHTSTLRRRLSDIQKIKRGGAKMLIVKALLKLVVIRNEASHLGLSQFSREQIYELLKSLVVAALIIWKAR